jgi:microcystin-dependent protein
MSQPFIGEIRMVGFNFAPAEWALCNGQLVAISENATLFDLIGTTYGGDGQTTFALPNLQGRIPVHMGSDFLIGQLGGTEEVTLNVGQIPAHAHVLNAQNKAGHNEGLSGNLWGESSLEQYSLPPATSTMGGLIKHAGGDQPHDNMGTFLVVNYVISLFGIFPSQS